MGASPAVRGAAPAVRGACPSVRNAFEERDGELIRIRLTGGVLTSGQLGAVAECASAAGATAEITSRANLQLRGISPHDLDSVTNALEEVGLADSGPGEVLFGPMTGLDPSELADVGPAGREAAARLATEAPAGLRPKFCALLDGGGPFNLRGRRYDLCLGAVRTTDGDVRFELHIGEPLPTGTVSDGQVVTTDASGLVSIVMAGAALGALEKAPLSEVVHRRGKTETIAEIVSRAGAAVEMTDESRLLRPLGPGKAPIGVVSGSVSGRVSGSASGRASGVVSVGAMPVLGRIQPAALHQVARISREFGRGEVRFTPWRSILLPDIARSAAPSSAAALTGAGLTCDPDDPAIGVVACAGSSGCPAGNADTQADGQALIDALRSALDQDPPKAPLRIHLSGCAKRCASRGGDDITFIAEGPDDSYDMYRDDAGAGVGPGQLEASNVPVRDVPDRVVGSRS